MKFICIKNLAREPKRLRHAAFQNANLVSAAPGGMVAASACAITVQPGQAVKVPVVVHDVVARRLTREDGGPAFERISEEEFVNLGLAAPTIADQGRPSPTTGPVESDWGEATEAAATPSESALLNFKLDELRAVAAPLGIDVEGKTKAELREAIAAAREAGRGIK